METFGNQPLASAMKQSESTENIPNFRIDFKFLQNWKKLSGYAAVRFLSLALSLAIVGVAGQALAARPGATGADVTNVQRCLKRLGYFNGPITGRFASQTESAVRKFQQANRLPVIGVVGPQTQRLLQQQCQAKGGRGGNVSQVMQLGSRGPSVTRLQENLRSLRFYNAPITGYFGQETQKAVIRFQQSYGLRATGVVGSATLNSIRTALNGGNGGIGGEVDSFPNALNLNDRGPQVSELQAALVQLRYLAAGNNTGYFGPITRDAVARFQRDYQLRVSGIADAQTLDTISRALRGQNPRNPDGDINCSQNRADLICLGERSQRVETVQQRLQQLGFFRGEITGYFGTATRDAVLQFQRYYQLNPTGAVDFQTWQALNSNNPPTGQNPSENRYVVVVPISDRDTLNRVRQFVPTAFSAQSRLGDYVNAGQYRERTEAENLSRQLRSQGLDARVEYF
ncbi:MAG: peptidoglycan-binding protein [Calothrix sp. SM1_7_51]|nr:peptidoglycan-binding protein [Calothrix sp. SM1_7_51]